MVLRRRAVAAAGAAGLTTLFAILLLRQLVTHDSVRQTWPFHLAASQVRAAGTTPLYEQGRVVSTRERADAIARAQVWREPNISIARAVLRDERTLPTALDCRFRMNTVVGPSETFDCLLEAGTQLRVKHLGGVEARTEAAASRLLQALGFGADTVMLVARLRCLGCPREQPALSEVTQVTSVSTSDEGVADERGRELEWVAVEQPYQARPIESQAQRGWAFFELEAVNPSRGGAPRAHVDALRLLSVFLAHWDNESANQRLVCLSEAWIEGTPCAEPFLMLDDVAGTFGPMPMDLESWKQSTIWDDRVACKVSMADLPYGGGTFGPTRISERGRRFLAKLLDQLTDAQLTDLFTWASFDQTPGPTTGTRPVSEWVRVFKERRRLISEGPPCPA